jgi:hypothetical protein
MRRLSWLFALCAACGSASDGKGDGGKPQTIDLGAYDGAVRSGFDASGGDFATQAPVTVCTSPVPAPSSASPTTTITTCDETHLAQAVAQGGVITFDCGTATIMVTSQIEVPIDRNTTIDGGGTITLDGGGKNRIFDWAGTNYRVNTHVFALLNLTLQNGKVAGTMPIAAAPPPCSQGFYDGEGGAVLILDGELYVGGCTFHDNQAEELGPDVAGGTIKLNGALAATIVNSNFIGNTAANGGAIGALNSELGVYDSVFQNNSARGNGANGDDATKCSVVDKNNQNQTGSGGNGGAISIDGGSDGTHTFCGSKFLGNEAGANALGGALFRTPDKSMQTTVIDRCLFEGNTDPQGGGGVGYFHNSTLTVTASTFHANSAPLAGAFQADGTTFAFTNDTFADNVGTNIGGTIALFNTNDVPPGGAISYTTFSGNNTPGFAAVIFGMPTLTFTGCLFQDDTAPGGPMQCQVTGSGSYDLQFPADVMGTSNADTLCTPTTTIADAKLGPLGDHGGPTPTLVPASGSPALGAGQSCPTTDQRGNARPATNCTIGAVEGSM